MVPCTQVGPWLVPTWTRTAIQFPMAPKRGNGMRMPNLNQQISGIPAHLRLIKSWWGLILKKKKILMDVDPPAQMKISRWVPTHQSDGITLGPPLMIMSSMGLLVNQWICDGPHLAPLKEYWWFPWQLRGIIYWNFIFLTWCYPRRISREEDALHFKISKHEGIYEFRYTRSRIISAFAILLQSGINKTLNFEPWPFFGFIVYTNDGWFEFSLWVPPKFQNNCLECQPFI